MTLITLSKSPKHMVRDTADNEPASARAPTHQPSTPPIHKPTLHLPVQPKAVPVQEVMLQHPSEH